MNSGGKNHGVHLGVDVVLVIRELPSTSKGLECLVEIALSKFGDCPHL
jgi:hypothetical protein